VFNNNVDEIYERIKGVFSWHAVHNDWAWKSDVISWCQWQNVITRYV